MRSLFIRAHKWDILHLPLVGRLLRRRYGRLLLQIPLLAAALLLIYDGFTGSSLASQNLATIAPWVHYRGLIIVALLFAGNLFCMGCPFTLPRTLAKRLSRRGPRFPQRLRNKWLAISGLFALFFLYEWLDLWASPALTAWVIIGYFVASFTLEAFFSESAFCKYVCPLGSFNFVYSTVSPLQIASRNLDTCRTCVGKECINGSYNPQPVILIDQIDVDGQPSATHTNGPDGVLGCGTLLFVPQIKSNLDCTLCLDCARACPHDNVALEVRAPAVELLRPDSWSKRWDVTLLVICLAFMGVVNAFGMVPPVYELMQAMAAALGLTRLGLSNELIEGVTLLILFAVGGIVLPIGFTLLAAHMSRSLGRSKLTPREIAAAFAPAFVPMGLGVWAAHYSFHFLTGALTIVPAFQQFLRDHGMIITPDWSLSTLTELNTVGLVQTLSLMIGFGLSLWVIQVVSSRLFRGRAPMALLPWVLLIVVIILSTVWIFHLPMEMRGTISFS